MCTYYIHHSLPWYECKTNDPIRKVELNVGAKTLLYLAQFSSDYKSVNSDINAI